MNKIFFCYILVFTAQVCNAQSNNVDIEMVFVQGGSFMMGSPEGVGSERPVHQVLLNDFYIGKYEVTQAQWKSIMSNNPSKTKGDNLPVDNVSWNDVKEFIRKLNQQTGKKYRLPTEAEWEYAARGGRKSKSFQYSGSNDYKDVAWEYENTKYELQLIGTKQPNELGIHDMSGNVYELCNDWFNEKYYSNSTTKNPSGPASGTEKVLRGGGYSSGGTSCKVVSRYAVKPEAYDDGYGFRLAISK